MMYKKTELKNIGDDIEKPLIIIKKRASGISSASMDASRHGRVTCLGPLRAGRIGATLGFSPLAFLPNSFSHPNSTLRLQELSLSL